jgi:hypothetical protein
MFSLSHSFALLATYEGLAQAGLPQAAQNERMENDRKEAV